MRYLILLFSVCVGQLILAQNLKSGGHLKPEQANMDIRHYTIALTVDPEKKSIEGYTEIDLNLLQSSSTLLFDLWQ